MRKRPEIQVWGDCWDCMGFWGSSACFPIISTSGERNEWPPLNPILYSLMLRAQSPFSIREFRSEYMDFLWRCWQATHMLAQMYIHSFISLFANFSLAVKLLGINRSLGRSMHISMSRTVIWSCEWKSRWLALYLVLPKRSGVSLALIHLIPKILGMMRRLVMIVVCCDVLSCSIPHAPVRRPTDSFYLRY